MPPPFDPKAWLLLNMADIKFSVRSLDRIQKFAVAKFLALTNYSNQPNEQIDERIIEDIIVKTRQADVLSKYRPAETIKDPEEETEEAEVYDASEPIPTEQDEE